MIYAIMNIILIIAIKVWYDNKQIRRGKGINHSKEWLIVAVCSLPGVLMMGGGALGKTIAASLLFMGSIWFFFDGFLNLVRGKNWWYTGINFSGSAKSDGFLQRFTPGFQKVIKFSALIIPLIFYLLIKLL